MKFTSERGGGRGVVLGNSSAMVDPGLFENDTLCGITHILL